MTLRRIQLKAIVLGIGTDIVGSIIGGMVVIFVLTLKSIPLGNMSTHPIGLILGLILGFFSTLVGGLVAGKIAKQSEVLHGGILGAIGLLANFLPSEPLPFWYHAVSFVGVIPIGMAGGLLAKRLNRK